MADLVFTIPGEPVAKGRPRIGKNRHTGRPVPFTPEKTERFESRARHEAWLAMHNGKRELIAGPVRLEISAFWPALAKSKATEPTPKDSRPDADNVAKAVCDALNTIVFRDDGQVVELVVKKWRAAVGEAARTEVRVVSLFGEWS